LFGWSFNAFALWFICHGSPQKLHGCPRIERQLAYTPVDVAKARVLVE
jgi:hypothetical protein